MLDLDRRLLERLVRDLEKVLAGRVVEIEDAVQDVVFAIVSKHGGSISAEHGIGIAKRERLPLVKDKTAIELMRTLKAVLDPNGILNPGKVL